MKIVQIRARLREELEKVDTPGNWNHITENIGMFSILGLTPQCESIIKNHSVYLMRDWRIPLPFISERNVENIAQAIKEVLSEAND